MTAAQSRRRGCHVVPRSRSSKCVVGVPKEIKTDEYRVAMIPVGVEELTRAGHKVLIQAGAGQGSGISDEQYAPARRRDRRRRRRTSGSSADLIVKVKEPLPDEWPLMRAGQIVFTYFHFAADETLTRAVMESGITAIAYETIKDAKGTLPLLTPMSEVAGRMSIQEGAKYLERPFEGRGILLGGVPGVLPANVVILGGGVVGANAAKVAAGLGAQRHHPRHQPRPPALPRRRDAAERDDALQRPAQHPRLASRRADLVIGAVLIPGAKAPHLVRRDDLKQHAAAGGDHRRGHRPGRLRRDVAADDAQPADVHRRRRRPLLRDEHARRGRPHQHLRADQRDAAVRAAAGEQGLRPGRRARTRRCGRA